MRGCVVHVQEAADRVALTNPAEPPSCVEMRPQMESDQMQTCIWMEDQT